MNSPGYPRSDICNECNERIFVFLSKRTGNEYAADTENPTTDFHKCRKWQPENQKQTREDADIEQASGNSIDEPVRARTTEPDPEPPKSGFIIEEITATVNRKAGDNTIRGLPAYENIDFRATLRAELLRGADVQQVFRELYAEGHKAIDNQIRETQAKFSK